MRDDTRTETTPSDAPSADESLFGDAADDAAAAVADEQHANEEPAQDRQGFEDAEEEAGQAKDLKVLMSIKGGRATIGVQQPASDPHIETFDNGHLAGLTQEVLPVIERARPNRKKRPSTRLTRDSLPRAGVSHSFRKVRRRPGPPRKGQTSSNPRR